MPLVWLLFSYLILVLPFLIFRDKNQVSFISLSQKYALSNISVPLLKQRKEQLYKKYLRIEMSDIYWRRQKRRIAYHAAGRWIIPNFVYKLCPHRVTVFLPDRLWRCTALFICVSRHTINKVIGNCNTCTEVFCRILMTNSI